MSTFHPREITCNCGVRFIAPLADSVNEGRMPEVRQKVLAGEFHRVTCPGCDGRMTVEKPFLYVNFERNTIVKVMPRHDRHLWKQASADLNRSVQVIPETISPADGRTLRVVFGLAELREKLVAEDAGLDDRLVELLKVFVIADHPFLVQKPRLRLVLHSATPEEAEFRASFEHDPGRFSIKMPGNVLNDLLGRRETLLEWANKSHGADSLFNLTDDRWVNLWRFSPQPSALDKLHSYATDVAAGKKIDTASKDFQWMLTYVPRGNQLPASAKQDLGVLFDYAARQKDPKLETALFKIRFDHALSDDWALHNDPDNIATLYKLLRALPESNVEGNTSLHEIILDHADGGFYETKTHDVHIGENKLHTSDFEHTVRHEIGHAVDNKYFGRVNPWVASRFGWQMLGTRGDNVADWQPLIDQWVGLMGGWGDLTVTQQTDVRGYLLAALGPGNKWVPGPKPSPPAEHPWLRKNFGPRKAFENTANTEIYWYNNYGKWHTYGEKAFFMNFYYRTFAVVDIATLNLITRMPKNYASMSSLEFFAELYATFYDVAEPKRSNLPSDVRDWLVTNIGAPRPGAPALAALPSDAEAAVEKPPWYSTILPD